MKKQVRKRTKARQSFVLGLLSDIAWLLTAIVWVFAWPVRALSNHIHHKVKHHTRFRHTRTVMAVSLGVALLVVSFVVETWFHHVIWTCGIETMRAAGVCPIWETFAAVAKISEDF